MTTPSTDVPSHYDPIQVFAEIFDFGLLANHVGPALTCSEVNVLAGALESIGRQDGARYWLVAHQQDCDESHLH
ncbi:hypothetical protein REH65_31220 [Saccharopolyspora sp. ID03-671]|uniref:hypothetical protein n=1 Tax=Saccharopolyspora sp. ID03-671 TaxID=3073066 RepID=UPI00325060D0